MNLHFKKQYAEYWKKRMPKSGVGGYGEVRPFYSTEAYRIDGNHGSSWRTVHLGLDVWTKKGVPVFALLDGVVHSIQNNAGDCNYGPTIILEHQVSDDLCFYTLYGHLSLQTLRDNEIGKPLKKGAKIGDIGAATENGNWPPHLHFQIILDLLGNEGDFPGVSFYERSRTWMSISPDPNWFIPAIKPTTTSGLSTSTIIRSRQKTLGASLSTSYDQPLHVLRGYMQHLYDITGRKYLDTVNNVPHVGHQHPKVVEVAQSQMAVLNTNTRYLHENIVLFAEELLAKMPPELDVVYFVNSGSEGK